MLKWIVLTVMLCAAMIWPRITHASTPLCTVNGASGTNVVPDCIAAVLAWPTGVQAEAQQVFFNTPDEAAQEYYDYMTTHTPGLCAGGCSLYLTDQTGGTGNVNKIINLSGVNAQGGSFHFVVQTNSHPTCPANYSTLNDVDSSGTNRIYECQPSATVKDGLNRAGRCDASNTDGQCAGLNPVDLGDLHKMDWEVDYQNQSPYPIVWARSYNGRIRQWVFNYDRHIQASLSATDPTKAAALLRRQDGQGMAYSGTLTAGVWTWLPSLGSVAKSNQSLLVLHSSTDLSSFTVTTHDDEIETYNSQGQLINLQDEKDLPLSFTYDSVGRLSHIVDASGRTLDITYPTGLGTQQTSITDANGHVTTGSYTKFTSFGDVFGARLPETVTDGTRDVGYVVNVNATDSLKNVVLSQVIKSDGATRTYNYDSFSQYAGLTDENGDRYSTYTTFSNNQVSQTYHGDHQETINYVTNKVTFPNGQSMTFGKDANTHKLTSQNNQCSWCAGLQYKSIAYDTAGNPITLTDFDNHVETRVYDTTRGVPTSITQGSGTAQARTTTYTWDARFLKPTVIVQPVQTPNGVGSSITTNTYDSAGNLTAWAVAVTGSGGYSASRSGATTYNSFGEPLTLTNARGKTTILAYDPVGNRLSITDALGHATTYGGYDTAGNVGYAVDPNGLRTEFTYDALQRISQVRQGCEPGSAPDCHWETTLITYNPMGKVGSITQANGRGLAYHYDTAHRRTQVDVTSNGTVLGSTQIAWNAFSEITGKTFKDASGNVLQSQTFGYDALSRLTAVIDSRAKAFAQTWDAQSNLATTTDPLSHGTLQAYDALDRLTQTTLPDTTTEGQGYGPDDTVISQTDALGHTTAYGFNGFGEVISRQSPDSGLTRYTRDADGHVLTQADARGVTLTTTYDDLDRPLTQAGTTAPITEAITFGYDSCSHGVGHLCTVVDRTGATAFTYDRWGRVTSRAQILNGHAYTQAYTYDTAGQLATLTYPSGAVLTQTWANGRVVSQTWNGQPILSSAQYDPWDKPLGWTWASGRTFAIGWDLDGRVSTIAAGAGASSQTYTYDDAWRLTGVAHNGTTETYGYDTRDRLTTGTTWGSYTYDANSNRLSWLGTLGPMSYGISPTSNRLTTLNSTAVSVDAAGNLTSKPGLALAYDDWSRLRMATGSGVTTTYGVNGLGERVGKAQGTTQRIYIYSAPGHLLGVYDGTTGLPLEEWAYLGERPVADAQGSQVYAIETDHLMAPLRVLDPTNATVWSWVNREPFGASAPIEGTVDGQPFQMGLRFPGQYADRETGLVSNGFRDYDPVVGKYVETDPTGLIAGLNLYGYVKASPLDKFDSFGLDEIAVNFYNSGARHVGISVNGGQSSGYYPVKSGWYDLLYAVGYSAPGHMRYDAIEQEGRSPSDVVKIEVSPDQAKKAVMEIEKMTKDPGDYNLYTNDCAHHVERALNAAGVKDVPDTMWPNDLFDSLKASHRGAK